MVVQIHPLQKNTLKTCCGSSVRGLLFRGKTKSVLVFNILHSLKGSIPFKSCTLGIFARC